MSSERLPHHSLPPANPRAARRPRVLVCACKSQEFLDVLRFLDGVETMHTPSSDIGELNIELNKFRPDLILCGLDFAAELISTKVTTIITEHDSDTARRGLQSLNSQMDSRDHEVLQLLANGATNADIAKALSLGLATVKRILQGLYEHFEVANRAELLGRAIELRLLQPVTPNEAA